MSANDPYFQRSPRLRTSMAKREMVIHRPPNAPVAPTFSVLSIIIPIVLTVAMGGAYYYFSHNQSSNPNALALQIVAMSTTLVSYIIPAILHLFKKRKYKQDLAKRESDYMAQLNAHRSELMRDREQETAWLNDQHPAPDVSMQRVATTDSSLWERSMEDSDFLELRLGRGQQPFSVQIKAPQLNGYETEPLVDRAQQLANEFARLENVPVCVPLRQSRVVGIVGDRKDVLAMVRTLAVQLTTHHSPDEVKVACLFDEREAKHWEWMRWLPHVWDDERRMRYLAKDRTGTQQILDQLYAVLKQRTLQETGKKQGVQMSPHYVFFLAAPQLVEDEPILPLLLREANAIGASTFLLADRKESLPMNCQEIIDVRGRQGVLLETVTASKDSDGNSMRSFLPDETRLEDVERMARTMAPLRLKKSGAGEIPSVLTLLDLFDISRVEELDVTTRWAKNRYPDTLPVPFGVRAGSKPVLINIHDKIERRGHGPHGLIAGTTGSGKSEVIQSVILSLAVQYHPHEVAFMLIDYKGGGMSNTFADLPHVVATITNLEGGGLLERAKVSLRAELERRQKLFNQAGNLQHIDEYYRSEWRDKEPLPHLIIVIDEFAQLKKEHPEFMAELISIAAIGRTLGVHLILATQKPAGVVDDKIWSNSRFRICLRVQDEADSRDMLKLPNAAWITTPGRGYFQVGSNEVFELVQSAWSGAPYQPEQAEPSSSVTLREVELQGQRMKPDVIARQMSADRGEAAKKPKQLQILTTYLSEMAENAGIPRLPGPWLPPLPEELFLLDAMPDQAMLFNGRNWPEQVPFLRPVIGLVDDLAHQHQGALALNVEDGHMGVYGMPGTGKTTFLQTMLLSLAMTHAPTDLHVYLLDFGRMLRDFEKLPHVGGIVHEEDAEKMKRLFRLLTRVVSERKELFSDVGAKTLSAYRRITGSSLPAVCVMIDGYTSFKNAYADESVILDQLLREGSNLGVYFIITANRVADLLDRTRSNLSSAVAFELADPSEYYQVVGRPSKPPVGLPPGRGLVKGALPPLEFHTALPCRGDSDAERTAHLRQQVQDMSDAWQGPAVPKIPVLPHQVPLTDLLDDTPALPERTSLRVPVALGTEDLDTITVDLQEGPYFIVGSRMEGGKTSFLTTWMLSLSYHVSPEQLHLYLVDFRRTPNGLTTLRKLPHVRAFATNEATLTPLLKEIRALIDERKANQPSFDEDSDELFEPVAPAYPAVVLVLDDVDLLAKQLTTIQMDLEYIVRQGRDQRVFIVLGGVPTDLNTLNISNKWLAEIKAMQKGFLFGSTESNDLTYFNVKLPIAEANKTLPPGQGLFIKRNHAKVKAALAYAGDKTPAEWVEAVKERWSNQLVGG